MTRLRTTHIATMTEMRAPQKVLDRAKGQPVAVVKNANLVGYFVPAAAVAAPGAHQVVRLDAVRTALEARRAMDQPVLDDLRDT
ncbi:MAG: hypothetical protein AAFQ19_07805 [Pseudomonadota bacterium]